jgi:hypothetical protein
VGADVTVTAGPTGELAVSPVGVVASIRRMVPGPEGTPARFTVRNQTGVRLTVRVRALPSIAELDDLMRVRMRSNGQRVFDGSLGALRAWTDATVTLASGQERDIELWAWLPPSVRSGYEGRILDVGLDFGTARAGG